MPFVGEICPNNGVDARSSQLCGAYGVLTHLTEKTCAASDTVVGTKLVMSSTRFTGTSSIGTMKYKPSVSMNIINQ